jgi:hypothetical protein
VAKVEECIEAAQRIRRYVESLWISPILSQSHKPRYRVNSQTAL